MKRCSNVEAKFFIPNLKDFTNGTGSFRGIVEDMTQDTVYTYRVYSYNTCIAEYRNGEWIINRTKYSVTTTKHQSIVAYALDVPWGNGNHWRDALLVYDIPRGEYRLYWYLERNKIV